jgi:hypothetical protein
MLTPLPHILSEEVRGQRRNEHLTLDSKVRALSSVIISVCWTLPQVKIGRMTYVMMQGLPDRGECTELIQNDTY